MIVVYRIDERSKEIIIEVAKSGGFNKIHQIITRENLGFRIMIESDTKVLMEEYITFLELSGAELNPYL